MHALVYPFLHAFVHILMHALVKGDAGQCRGRMSVAGAAGKGPHGGRAVAEGAGSRHRRSRSIAPRWYPAFGRSHASPGSSLTKSEGAVSQTLGFLRTALLKKIGWEDEERLASSGRRARAAELFPSGFALKWFWWEGKGEARSRERKATVTGATEFTQGKKKKSGFTLRAGTPCKT